MRALTYTSLTLFGLLVMAVFVALNLSVQQLADFDALGVELENTQDARVKSGSVKVRSDKLPGLGVVDLGWHWCPTRGLLNWCIELQSEPLQVQGQIAYRVRGALAFYALEIDLQSLTFLGVVPGLMDARLRGQIDAMQIRDFNCPLHNVEGLRGRFVVADPQILGSSLKDINASIEQQPEEIVLSLSSDDLQGGFRLDKQLMYMGEGEITPPASLVGLMDSMAIPLGGGRYGWELSGEIPC